jgi:hypothetical protein
MAHPVVLTPRTWHPFAFLPLPCDIAQRMKLTWRFLLGAAIGAGVGYAVVLLVQPAPKRRVPRWRTLYQASPEQREEQTAT